MEMYSLHFSGSRTLMEESMNLLGQSILGNTVDKWFIALFIIILGTVVLSIIAKFLGRTFTSLQGKFTGDIGLVLAEMFHRTKRFVLFIISIYAGSKILALPASLETFLSYLAVIAGGIQIGIWAAFLITKFVSGYVISKTDQEEIPSGIAVATLLARVIVWAFIVLLVLDNLGFNITTLVAGLGVGGIAIAMASQNILADLFASLSILLDKPFKVGDFIIVGEFLGSVEHIGLKTTRLRSLGGEQLVFSNTDLLSSRIRNYKRMLERRIAFTIGVEYNTEYEKLKLIPEMIKDIISSVELTRFDRCHFISYGDFSLKIETVYYILSPDYNIYANVQQEINLKIFKKFKEEEIVFAFPTQTIHLSAGQAG
ncbi:MAG: mechanosensitive ion channel family protein [Desulfatiglandaceae bacterium]